MESQLGFREIEASELSHLSNARQAESKGRRFDFTEANFLDPNDSIHGFLASVQGVPKESVKYPDALQTLWRSWMYIDSQKRPEMSLLASQNVEEGVPFFVSHSGLLMKSGPLQIQFPFPLRGEFAGVGILDSQNREVAQIYPKRQGVDLVDRRKNAVFMDPGSIFREEGEKIWSKGMSFDQMIAAIQDEARERELEIPTEVLQNLFAIRQIDQQSRSRPETVTQALAFLVDISNQPYLEFDSVQRFLQEIFLDHFLVMNALFSRAELFADFLSLLNSAVQTSFNADRVKTGAFLVNMQAHLLTAVERSVQELTTHGMSSRYYWNEVPGASRSGGTDPLLIGNIETRVTALRNAPKQDIFGEQLVKDSFVEDPLLDTLSNLMEARATLIRGQMSPEETELILIEQLKSPLLSDIEKKALYVELLFVYSRQKSSFSNEQYVRILDGVRLLSDASILSEKEILISHLLSWYKNEVAGSIQNPETFLSLCC
jgi:hypothetical protein